ncbi:peroxisomal carnitine O-octanoyltransferase-like isoform X2 [Actinia tenebrosa]|nr:peroxisomal carnitine O-octanoyltransferase-like isoform X2 [Actinia tenebrosa]
MGSNTRLSQKEEKTFQYQDSLPRLPVPSLEQTCNKYLESVKPLVNETDYLQTDFLINEFKNGVGKELQKKLLQKGQEQRNWLEKWWEEEGYLRPRYPITPYVNIGGPVSSFSMWPPLEGTQIKRSAILTNGVLHIWQQIYKEEMQVQKMSNKPLCMNQYARVFAGCRVPGKEVDKLKILFKPAPASSPRHIVVQINSRLFSCTVLEENYEPFTAPEIERSLQEIVKIASSKSPGPAVGVLTAGERHTWYELREHLKSLSPRNVNYLNEIETALFILVLEEHDARQETEISQHSIAGDCKNRWFDKFFSILAFKAGLFATHCDHCPFEGVVDADVVEQALALIQRNNGEWKGRKEIKNSIPPYELDFVIDNQIAKGIEVAATMYQSAADNLEVLSHHFDEFGKNVPKSLGIHPDTFCQMAIQLTHYRIHKKPAPTYETAQTRQFYHGRTDTVRSCTEEALNWCKAMVDPKKDINFKAQLLHKACLKHGQLMMEGINGQAIDRHLLGLSMIAKEEGIPTPQIYLDKSWTKSGGSGNYTLSTSCVGFTEIYGSCAPMVADGYGIFYSIEEHRFNISFTRWRNSQVTDVHRFRDEFWKSLCDMRDILQAVSKL